MDSALPQTTTQPLQTPQKFNQKWLMIGLGISIVVLTALILYLFIKNRSLEKEISSLLVTPTPTSTIYQGPGQEKMSTTYSGRSFSFLYPEDLYPLSDVFENVTIVDFYLNEYHAKKTQECLKLNKGTLEDPCGFGWDVMAVKIYINSKDKNSNFDSLLGSGQNKNFVENYTDLKGRNWQIVQPGPIAGLRVLNAGWWARFTNDGNNYIVDINVPYYSAYRVNLNFVKQVLSTFAFTE